MTIKQKYMTKNDCYTAGRKITPQGVMIHSTAAPGVMAAAWFDRWNRSYKAGETDRQVCTHAFVDNAEAWQYLPWDHRGWHCGGSGNNTHIGIELCEPAGHTYDGAKMVGYDAGRQADYFAAVWDNAVELTAQLCRQYGLDPMEDGVVVCHSEGHARGIASNHADVMHWFPQHGKDMDDFRAAVKARLADESGASGSNGSGGNGDAAANPYPAPAGSLRRGMKGDEVKWLQFALDRQGAGIAIDGSFGAATLAAVQAYQEGKGLDPDGSVGPLTRAALVADEVAAAGTASYAANPYPAPAETLQRGAKGDEVKWLQFALNRQGAGIAVDGSFGADTLAAVKAYQGKRGLDVDGSVGPLTRAALLADEAAATGGNGDGSSGAADTVYTVQAGDTLTRIAKAHGTTWETLADYNGIENPSLIHVGQEIKIPQGK